MDEWLEPYKLPVGRCFEMYFKRFNQIIKFKVISKREIELIKAKNCNTGKQFEFYRSSLLAVEYKTLRENACNNC